MAQQKIQGMRLRQTKDSRKENNNWLLQMLVSLAACMVLLWSGLELAGFGGSNTMAVMLAVGVYLCLLYGLLLRAQHRHWFFIGVLVLMLLLVLACRNLLLEGYRLFWNQMSDAKVRGTGWILPEWELQLPAQKSKLCLTLFAILLAGAVSLGSCAAAFWTPSVLAVLLPGTALAGMAFFGRGLSFSCLSVTLILSVLILMYSGWGSRDAQPTVCLSWMIGTAAAVLLILPALLPSVQTWTEGVGERMQKTIHQHRYETEHTTLPEGDFTAYAETEKGAEAALTVTMEIPEMMYLRGFTGGVFEEDQWRPIEKELLAENKELLYWLNLNAFDPNAQFAAASDQVELPVNTVMVRNIGACSRYRYVPFSLCAGEFLEPENLNTEGVLSEGEREYTCLTVFGGAEAVSQVLQHLQASDDPAVLRYRKAESGYRNFVYQSYLQIPEDVKQLLADQWDKVSSVYGGAGNLTVQQGQECALRFLSKCFPENGTPEDMELPLDAARGTFYQYATVAALTLRYFGIPARYAEGYVITEIMAASAQPGESLTVDSSCARAWVEVYQDGIGWIPMDMTPGLGEMIQEDPEDSSAQSDGDTLNEDLEPEETEEDSPMEGEEEVPDPDGGSVVRVILAAMTELLKLLLILAGIFLLLWLRRRHINQKKEKRFRDKDRKEAVAWIFADAIHILEELGIDRGSGSLRQLYETVEGRYGEQYAQQFDRMIDLNDRAMFSSHPMEEHHRVSLLQFRDATIQNVNTQVKWYKRLWLKWVRCLY